METNNLISEIYRIKEMMGITEGKTLLTESVGDEIIEALLKFLKKEINNLKSQGVKGIGKLVKELEDPITTSARRIEIFKDIMNTLPGTTIKGIAKKTIDDLTEGVGQQMDKRIRELLDLYERGNLTYGDVISQINDDLANIMLKTPDEVLSLKNAIKDEVVNKTKTMLGSSPKSVSSTVNSNTTFGISEKISKNFEYKLKLLKEDPKWSKISNKDQRGIEELLETGKNNNQSLDDLFKDASNVLSTKEIPKGVSTKIWEKVKWFLKNWRSMLGILGLSTVLYIFYLISQGKLGEVAQNLEDNTKGVIDVVTKDKKTPTTGCDQTLDSFKQYLKSEQFSEKSVESATFNEETCSGTIQPNPNVKASTFTWNGSKFV